ncbi:hypothetical protein COO60DRAFT_714395 [Scenedesmus sp. NREL 46B-D3]|nr:hypothetical protein COO60DRAFT_714395 [Scenedesmus sp. NREL 46B-D3]
MCVSHACMQMDGGLWAKKWWAVGTSLLCFALQCCVLVSFLAVLGPHEPCLAPYLVSLLWHLVLGIGVCAIPFGSILEVYSDGNGNSMLPRSGFLECLLTGIHHWQSQAYITLHAPPIKEWEPHSGAKLRVQACNECKSSTCLHAHASPCSIVVPLIAN